MATESKLKTIVVPWNFSTNSDIALRRARNLASETTRIHVVHVAAPLTSSEYGLIELMDVAVCPYEERFAKQYPHFAKDKRIRFQAEYGLVGRELSRYARSVKPDLVVLGASRRSRFVQMFFGDVVKQLEALELCPIMVVKNNVEHPISQPVLMRSPAALREPAST